jgi:hypothetical protein
VGVQIDYPAVQYFTPKIRHGVTVAMVPISSTHKLLQIDKPRRWLDYDAFVPGGVLDSVGRDIPIMGITNWRPCPWWYKPFEPILGVGLFGWPWKSLDIVYGEPKILDLPAFKEKLCKIIYSERTMHHGGYRGYRALQTAIKRADSYRAALDEIYPPKEKK